MQRENRLKCSSCLQVVIKVFESTAIFQGQVELSWKDVTHARKKAAQDQDHTPDVVSGHLCHHCWHDLSDTSPLVMPEQTGHTVHVLLALFSYFVLHPRRSKKKRNSSQELKIALATLDFLPEDRTSGVRPRVFSQIFHFKVSNTWNKLNKEKFFEQSEDQCDSTVVHLGSQTVWVWGWFS